MEIVLGYVLMQLDQTIFFYSGANHLVNMNYFSKDKDAVSNYREFKGHFHTFEADVI